MSPPVLSFSHLKGTVSIETVLNAEGLSTALKRHGQRLVGPCPVHGGDNPHAFVVDLTKDLWYCFTRCQGGGDVVELVRRVHHVGYRQCAHYLASLARAPTSPPSPVAASPKKPFQPYIRSLRLDPLAPLLQQKGIGPETAHRFEAGGYEGRGFLQGCIAVRLHDPQARPLGYAGRRLDSQQARRYGKWKFPPGLPKRELLYGFHHIATQLSQGLVVVESPWSVMRLMQLGLPTVALLGIQLSSTQLQLLRQSPRIVLMLDGDDAGRSASRKIANTLTQHTAIRVHRIELPQGLDPDDLSDTDLTHRLHPCFS
jgi:DNA primase